MISAKKQRKIIEWERLLKRVLFKKIIDTKGIFHANMGSINDRMIFVGFQGKLFTIKETQIYAQTTNAEEAEIKQFHEDLQEN